MKTLSTWASSSVNLSLSIRVLLSHCCADGVSFTDTMSVLLWLSLTTTTSVYDTVINTGRSSLCTTHRSLDWACGCTTVTHTMINSICTSIPTIILHPTTQGNLDVLTQRLLFLLLCFLAPSSCLAQDCGDLWWDRYPVQQRWHHERDIVGDMFVREPGEYGSARLKLFQTKMTSLLI